MQAAEHWQAGRREAALQAFYIGQLRGRINVGCVEQQPDGGPALLGALQESIGAPINGWAGGEIDKWLVGIDAALAWDAANNDTDVTTSACIAEQSRQRAGLRELRSNIDKGRARITAERRRNGLDR
jgi:hypothetical protein